MKLNVLANKVPAHHSKPSDVAYIHHSSGTSSGVLKPISQTHRAAVGVLPRLDGRSKASFSTTPLYHGGIADCLRAWTSRAMIWLFPENEIPITAANLLRCLDFADAMSEKYTTQKTGQKNSILVDAIAKGRSEDVGNMRPVHSKHSLETSQPKLEAFPSETLPHVAYFSCVPYVLKIIAQEKAGQTRLRRMELVGIGGTALSQTDGDTMVQQGIKLISRYGSTECGFLLSSNRCNDDEWQFLRVPNCSKFLRLEAVQDGLAELIVRNGWPHMAKRNLPDESYATSDLFEQHPRLENAWKYHSRKDSLITLSTGKKFDPEPLERSIVAISGLVRDVLVFGSGRSYPGALLFCEASPDLGDKAILDRVWPGIDQVNRVNSPHANLQRTALALKRVSRSSECLPKSSKGTVLRAQAELQYQKLIKKVYGGRGCNNTPPSESKISTRLPSSTIHEIIADAVHSILGSRIDDDADLLREGLKSQQSTEIRNVLSSRLLQGRPGLEDKISLTVAYDQETIRGLSQYYELRLHGEIPDENEGLESEEDWLRAMIQLKQTRISTARLTSVSLEPMEAIILTGATGTLGVHLLDKIRATFPRRRIYCVVRRHEGKDASTRSLRNHLSAELEARRKAPLSASDGVTMVACEARKARFGLDEKLYNEMTTTASLIVHAAWDVNFAQPLRTFKDQFTWLVSLLELSHQATFSGEKDVNFFFCSSIASVGHILEPLNSEKVSMSPRDATPVGYSRSKWVAEQICLNACQDSNKDHKGLDVHVLRIGQLCGDTENGVWNNREAIPLLLSTKDMLGCLPKHDSRLDWLPVNTAAQSVVEIVSSIEKNKGRTGALHSNSPDSETSKDSEAESFHVYHVTNPQPDPEWNKMLEWINEEGNGQFQLVDGPVWFQKLENFFQDPELKHPSEPLLPIWDQAYNKTKAQPMPSKVFETTKARNLSPTLNQALSKPVITRALISKIGRWINSEMRINSASTSSTKNL